MRSTTVGYLSEMATGGYNPQSIGAFHRVMIPYLLRELCIEPDDLVVDVGAAQGHCVIAAKLAGYGNLAVVDVDACNFELFETRHGICCYRRDIEQDRLPFDDAEVRLIIAFHVLEHLMKPANFLRETVRVLNQGGTLAVVTPDWRKQYRSFWRDPTHVHPYDKESIARLVRMYGLSAEVHSWNGRYGTGRLQAYRLVPRLGMVGADILAVARKV